MSCDPEVMTERHFPDTCSRGLAGRMGAGDFDAWFKPRNVGERRTEGQKAFFLLLAEVVRGEHDPATEWDAFCQQLWVWTDAAFGITPQEES